MTSSSAVFELGLIERKNFQCVLGTLNRPEIYLYKTERHYTEEDRQEDLGEGLLNLEDDDEDRALVGKIFNPCTGWGKQRVIVFENMQGALKPKYEVVKT